MSGSGKKKRSLKISVIEGSFASVMGAAFDQFLIPFAVAINSTVSQIGFIRAAPQFGASVVQFFAPDVADRLGEKKKLVVAFVFLQALCLALFVGISLWLRNPYAVVAGAFFLSIFGSFVSPLWSGWMGDLTDVKTRGSYFSHRNKVTGIVSFVAILAFGYFLDRISNAGNQFLGFTILFAIAALTKVASTYLLSQMHEPKHEVLKETGFFRKFMGSLFSTNFGRFVLFMTFMAFAMNFASAFFSVYLLQDLHFNYLQYTLVTLAGTVVSFLFMAYWGAKADAHGNRLIFTITSFVLPLIPLLWLFSASFYYIALVQAFASFIWAGFSISAFNFVYDAVETDKRTRVISYYNILGGFAVVAGTAAGGFFLSSFPVMFASKFQQLFFVSFVLRLAVVLAFFRGIQEVRKIGIQHKNEHELIVKFVFTEPIKEIVGNVMAAGKKVGKAGIVAASTITAVTKIRNSHSKGQSFSRNLFVINPSRKRGKK